MNPTPLFDDTPRESPYDALEKLIGQIPRLAVDYENWNIQGALPQDSVMIFVDKDLMDQFTPFAPLRTRTIKLVNYGKPAIQITLFLTHRYDLKKADRLPAATQRKHINRVITQIRSELAALLRRENDPAFDQSKEHILQQDLASWLRYQQTPEDYDVAISNYERYYYYHTLNYKYELSEPDRTAQYANESVHLIKTQADTKGGEQNTRYNVVFVDSKQLVRPVAYQNKLIHTYLETFPDKHPIKDGKDIVYIRPKNSTK